MAITVPGVGDPGTASWADAVANQLNVSPISINGASNVPATAAANKIQSGTATLTFSASPLSNSLTLTFPVAFSTTPAITFGATLITGNTIVAVGQTGKSATGCTVRGYVATGGNFTGTLTFDWIAVGT